MYTHARTFALAILAFVLFGKADADEAKPVLTVYTYDSFAAEWGPGPAVEAAFESACRCDLQWVAVGDAGILLSRIRLEGKASRADVVLGLDTSLMAEAKATGLFAPHGLSDLEFSLPVKWVDTEFLPYDYGHFAFVYDSERLTDPPESLAELVENDGPKVILQDPRTSTPGLGLLLWMQRIYGKRSGEAWSKLSRRILTFTKGWSEAYGLFLKGEAPMVLSYATSPAYHKMYEDTERYKAAVFSEGHYMQIEVAARTRASRNPDLARQFLEFMVSEAFQEHIPGTNIMNPVIDLEDKLPEAFRDLQIPATAEPFAPEEIAQNRKTWIAEWVEHVSR